MRWRFTIDSDDFPNQVIDEPVGWDKAVISLKRDAEKHGIFFDYSFSFKFAGGPTGGFNYLKELWITYGIEAVCTLKIEAQCNPDPEDGWLEFYNGRMDFTQYSSEEGTECLISIPVETPGCLMQFNNLFDQPVNLDTGTSRNGNELIQYQGLGKDIQLLSKGILKKVDLGNSPENSADYSETINADHTSSNQTIYSTKYWKFYFDKEKVTEIDTLQNDGGLQYFDNFLDVPPLFTVTKTGDYNVNIALSFSLDLGANPHFTTGIGSETSLAPGVPGGFWDAELDVFLQIGGTLSTLFTANLNNGPYPVTSSCDPPNSATINAYNINYINPAIHLIQGSVIRLFAKVRFGAGYFVIGGLFRISVDFCQRVTMKDDASYGNHFIIKIVDYFDSTPAKLYMVNEALSRIAECQTDDCLRVYSDYYGRTDAQPYPSSEIGCGGMRALTSGLFIRQFPITTVDGVTSPQLSLSFKDMWEGLSPIDNVGIGLEDDPNRPGNKLIRIERMEYFYQEDTIVLTCDKIAKVKVRQVNDNIFTNIKIGYNKWEAEEFSGLDEFATDRQYRTDIDVLSKTKNIISKFIASGYAIEITRRHPYKETSTQDWRFDNETFIICLKPTKISFGTFASHTINIAEVLDLTPGDIITLSGTASNNGDFTVVSATQNFPADGFTQVIVSEAVTTEGPLFSAFIAVNGRELFNYAVETNNIDTPANLIDPTTVYNFRLSPVRNLMRWMQVLMNSYHDLMGNAIKFVSGTANYLASGRINNGCEQPTGVLSESEDITVDDFDDPTQATPLWDNYLITFDYPMSIQDWIALKANPYGIIKVRWGVCAGDFIETWIKQLDFKPNEGIASFTVIPKSTFRGEGIGFDMLENTFKVN